MTNIVNCTPHPICVKIEALANDGQEELYTHPQEYTYEPAGEVARVNI